LSPATPLTQASQEHAPNAHDDLTNESAYGFAGGTTDRTAVATTSGASKASAACSAARYAGPGDELLMQAAATLNGRPVKVYVFEGHGEHTVVVLGPNCRLVNVQFAD